MALGYFERLPQNCILVSHSKKILFFVGVTLLIIVLSTIPVMYSVTAQNETSPNTINLTLVGQVNVEDLPKAAITTQPSVEIPFMTIDSRLYVEMEEDAMKARSTTMALAAPQVAIQESSTNLNILAGFEGLAESESGFLIPPDVQVATGPNHVFEMVNSQGRIWTKDGTQVSDFSLSTFFNTPGEVPFDPKIFFDTQSDRWFASVTTFSNNVRLAVSSTNNPTGTWVLYNVSYDIFFPDQPRIGASDDKFVVSTNDFIGNAFFGAHVLILDKNQMIAGATITNFQDLGRDNTRFSVKPVQSLSSTSPLYMVSTNPGVNTVTLHTITGSPPSANIATLDLTIIIPLIPPGGIQQGTTNLIDTGGNRILDARWFEGDLWFTLNDLCIPIGDTARSCVHLVQIDTVTSTVSQDFFLGAAGFYFFYPAISIDSLGGLGVVFGFSNAATFPSIAVTGRKVTDPLNTVENPVPIKVGTDFNPTDRYGDYFGASVDPTFPNKIWVAGQYHKLPTWSTWIGSFTLIVPTAFSKSLSDSSSTNDALSSGAAFSKSLSDSSSTNDALSSGAAFSKSLSDSSSTNDVLSSGAAFSKSLSDSSSTNDALSSGAAFSKSLSDSSSTNDVITNIPSCTTPSTGDWTITSSCTLSASSTAPANVIVQNNSLLTIPSGVTLTVPSGHNITVVSGSGILIKSGGTLRITV